MTILYLIEIIFVSIQNKEFHHGIFRKVSYPTLLEVALPMITILCVCVCGYYNVLSASIYCTICMQYAQRPERGIDHLGLELQTIVNF